MKGWLLGAIAVLLLLVGCLPNPVSVSKDGTIALTLSEEGKYKLIQSEGEQVYLTNANADFLEKVEGMDECRFPVISPSGRYIAACSGEDCLEKLVLYDRETKKRRTIYRRRDDDLAVDFPSWSPDDRKIAFFEGDYEGPHFTLRAYDVKRRELEVLDRRAAPQATWLPDSKRLLYLSLSPGWTENEEAPTYDLRMTNVGTGKRKTLARGRLFAYSKIDAFPEGRAVLFSCVNWEDMEFGRSGVTAPFVLKKELLLLAGKKAAKRKSSEVEAEEATEAQEAEAKPDAGEALPAATEEGPKEEGFVLREGQPFHPYTCAVSPDGSRIAYVRPIWKTADSAEPQGAEEEKTESEKPEEVEGEPEEPAEGEKEAEPEAWEVCVAKGDGTGSVAILRSSRDESFIQVIWVSDTRLLCVTEEEIIAVDADGENKFDLTEAIRVKFADRFEPGEEKEAGEQADVE